MRKTTAILVLCILTWASASLIKPAFCHPAEVSDVVPRDVDGFTHLNITVWHNVESPLHFVDTIEVTWGTNLTSLTINPEPLAPDGTFTLNYNMGPVSGTPTITVRARCTVTGYSGATSWTGTITTPSPTPSSSPTPTPTPTPTITPSPSPSPTEIPSPSPTVTASPNPTSTPSIPEFPSFLAPLLLVALTVIAALLYSKRQFGFLK